MAIYVKAHRRGKAMVKAFTRAGNPNLSKKSLLKKAKARGGAAFLSYKDLNALIKKQRVGKLLMGRLKQY